MSHAPTEAVQECETLLRKMVEDLRARRIWPSLCSIIDGLLMRTQNSEDAFGMIFIGAV